LKDLLRKEKAGGLSAVNERMSEDGREDLLHPTSSFVRLMQTSEGKLYLSCDARLELTSGEK
jgi:hypothetical protein